MKIIILAAGKGERLASLTRDTPKSLLDMGNGKTLLEEQLERIRGSRVIDEVVLVVGYLAEQIETKVKSSLSHGLKIKTAYNPFYETSNNLISLWFAKHDMDSDFMITNGDNIFSTDVFSDFAGVNKNGIFLSISEKDQYDDDDMKVSLKNGQVVKVSKLISPEDCHAESPGLALIRGEKFRQVFKENMELLVRDKKNMGVFWLETFNALAEKGTRVLPWRFDGQNKWQEIDFHMDIHKAKMFMQLKNI